MASEDVTIEQLKQAAFRKLLKMIEEDTKPETAIGILAKFIELDQNERQVPKAGWAPKDTPLSE